jgi:DNA-binding transcriptional LysR family regulator
LAQGVQQKFPHIELILQGQMYANAAQESLIKGDIEVGFVRLPFTLPGLSYRPIEEETLVCVVPADHPLTSRDRVSVSELAQEPFVTFPRGSGSTLRSITHRVCWDHGFVPNVVQDAPDSYTIQALVAAGQGITLSLSSTTHIQQPGVKYIALEGNIPRFQSALAWRADNTSAAVASVIEVADAILPKPKWSFEEQENAYIDSDE